MILGRNSTSSESYIEVLDFVIVEYQGRRLKMVFDKILEPGEKS